MIISFVPKDIPFKINFGAIVFIESHLTILKKDFS